MIKSILQHVANQILKNVINAKSLKLAENSYRVGMNFDNFCISTFGIYLD